MLLNTYLRYFAKLRTILFPICSITNNSLSLQLNMLGAASHSSELDDSARLASSLQKKIPVYLREAMVEQRFLHKHL